MIKFVDIVYQEGKILFEKYQKVRGNFFVYCDITKNNIIVLYENNQNA
jgi:hypothetical protein